MAYSLFPRRLRSRRASIAVFIDEDHAGDREVRRSSRSRRASWPHWPQLPTAWRTTEEPMKAGTAGDEDAARQ
jgi:hypothetical protein